MLLTRFLLINAERPLKTPRLLPCGNFFVGTNLHEDEMTGIPEGNFVV